MPDLDNKEMTENGSLFEKLRKSRDSLEMIYRASKALNNSMDLDHLLEVVIADLVRVMQVEATGVLLYDERAKDFYWREVQDDKGLLVTDGTDPQIAFDRTIIERTFQSGEPFVVDRTAEGSFLWQGSRPSGDSEIENAIVVPLNTREKTIGTLVLVNKAGPQATEEDMHLCQSLAGLLAVSVENADIFDDLMRSHRKLQGLDRIKSKILNRLSHELKTPLAIIEGSLRTVERKAKASGLKDFDRPLERVCRQLQNLKDLEFQVESLMTRGHVTEGEMISGLLESAASLMEVQAEQTPEIKHAAYLIIKTLEQAFPSRHEEWRQINIKQFGESVIERVRSELNSQGRNLDLQLSLDDNSEVLIPELVLHAVIEGLVRNAVHATPDSGKITILGKRLVDRYVLSVADTGIGIPEEDWGLVFDGFYQVQDTDDYTTGRPYSFNAGGKGMDLFRIKMFSQIYGFDIFFRSRRCQHLGDTLRDCPGTVNICPHCDSPLDCAAAGGTTLEVDFPLTADKV
jgi:signal transduction histidine kinase